MTPPDTIWKDRARRLVGRFVYPPGAGSALMSAAVAEALRKAYLEGVAGTVLSKQQTRGKYERVYGLLQWTANTLPEPTMEHIVNYLSFDRRARTEIPIKMGEQLTDFRHSTYASRVKIVERFLKE